MRFTLHTSDGLGFVVKDKGKVIARGVLAGQIREVIEKRMAGDEWRKSIQTMRQSWMASLNQHARQRMDIDGWDHWAKVRQTSWRNRCRAVVNMIARGDYIPKAKQFVRYGGRETAWEQACERMARSYEKQRSHSDEWSKWASNTASNQRKRMRAKAERAANISQDASCID